MYKYSKIFSFISINITVLSLKFKKTNHQKFPNHNTHKKPERKYKGNLAIRKKSTNYMVKELPFGQQNYYNIIQSNRRPTVQQDSY